MSEKRSDRAPKKICCIKLLSFCAFARKKAYRSAFALGLSRLICLFYSVDPFAFTSFDILRALSRIFAHTAARLPCRCLCLFARMMLFFGQNCDLDLVLCSKFFSALRQPQPCSLPSRGSFGLMNGDRLIGLSLSSYYVGNIVPIFPE